jgi:hypothetical protein
MAEANFSIKKFDPKTMPDSPVIVAIAKRRSGKSFLVRDLLYQMRKRFVGGIVMSATEEANNFYSDMGIPKAYIYHEFDEAALERLIETQKRLTKAGKAQPVFVVLDDVAYNKTIFNKSVIRQLALNGRHYRITLVIALQYALDIQPAIRSNIDYVMLLRDNINREKLYKNFFNGLLPNFAFFNELMDNCTRDYRTLVLDNAAHSTNLGDIVSWYKAKDRKKFRVGSENYYRFNSKRLKKEDAPADSGFREKKKRGIKLLH